MTVEETNPQLFQLPIGVYNLKVNGFYYFKSEDIKENKAPEITEYEVYIWSKPKRNCNHCYGRGYFGIDIKSTFYIPCRCIKAKFRPVGFRKEAIPPKPNYIPNETKIESTLLLEDKREE